MLAHLLVLLLLFTFGGRSATFQGQDVPAANDLVALNYALTLEHLEATFYTSGLMNFTMADFAAAGFNSTAYSYFLLVRNHEQAHVDTLTQAISTFGGTPVPPCTYNFGVRNVSGFVALARVLENTGVMAYTGAVNTIENQGLLTVAATIATVEARHASILNELNGQVPFPDAFDTPVVPTGIAGRIAPLLASCPYTLQFPANATANFVNPPGEPGTTTAGNTGGTFQGEPVLANDLIALNYALTLEHLEATFYTEGSLNFTAADFAAAGFNASVYAYFILIRNHEQAHVNTLSQTVTAFGGTPVPACTYNFGVGRNVTRFVALARVLENTGVMAYTGAINTLSNQGLLMVAATIATVEARHAAYLNELNGAIPFPSAFDTPVVPSGIVPLISPLLASCPYNLVLPFNATRATPSSTSSSGSTTASSVATITGTGSATTATLATTASSSSSPSSTSTASSLSPYVMALPFLVVLACVV